MMMKEEEIKDHLMSANPEFRRNGFRLIPKVLLTRQCLPLNAPCSRFNCPLPSNRMLKKSASFVLGSSKSSTYPREYASGFDSPAALLTAILSIL